MRLLLFLYLLLFTAGEPRTIRLIADGNDRFRLMDQAENVLVLKPGEKIVLHVEAKPGPARAHDGAIHSLVVRKLRDQGWNIRLKEGVQEIALTAPGEAGEYLIECTVFCGPGHPSMNLKMIVRN